MSDPDRIPISPARSACSGIGSIAAAAPSITPLANHLADPTEHALVWPKVRYRFRNR